MALGHEERSRKRVWGGITVKFPNRGANTVVCIIDIVVTEAP